MTETQGDYLGCVIVLLGFVPLLLAVQRAERNGPGAARVLMALSLACSVLGVATVILT